MNKQDGKAKKPFYKKWWFWVIVVGLVIAAVGGSNDSSEVKEEATYGTESPNETTEVKENDGKNTEEKEKEQKEREEEQSEVKVEAYSTELTAGYYTGGVQLPIGKYNISLISGSGNVFSDTGLNEIFDSDTSFGIDKYNNFRLSAGDILNISGNLKLKLECEEADMSTLSELDNSSAEEIELETGNYIAGEDFPVGTYDIVRSQGDGNVFVDEGLIVNEMIGADETYYIKQFKNCTFTEGTTIELSGVSVKLIPSECKLQK